MSDVDLAVARAYLSLAADLALKAANIASACEGAMADKMEKDGDDASALLKAYR